MSEKPDIDESLIASLLTLAAETGHPIDRSDPDLAQLAAHHVEDGIRRLTGVLAIQRGETARSASRAARLTSQGMTDVARRWKVKGTIRALVPFAFQNEGLTDRRKATIAAELERRRLRLAAKVEKGDRERAERHRAATRRP